MLCSCPPSTFNYCRIWLVATIFSRLAKSVGYPFRQCLRWHHWISGTYQSDWMSPMRKLLTERLCTRPGLITLDVSREDILDKWSCFTEHAIYVHLSTQICVPRETVLLESTMEPMKHIGHNACIPRGDLDRMKWRRGTNGTYQWRGMCPKRKNTWDLVVNFSDVTTKNIPVNLVTLDVTQTEYRGPSEHE